MVRMCSGNLPDLMTMNPVVKIHEHFVPACLEQQKRFSKSKFGCIALVGR